MKNRNKIRLYRGLWSRRTAKAVRVVVVGEDITGSIDEICISADLCTNLEDYVETLCAGMVDLLNLDSNQKYIKSHMALEDKVKRIGEDIMDQGHFKSDLFYIGVFADFKLSNSWLDKRVYEVIRSLLNYVLKQGNKISDDLKNKIILKLKSSFPKKYKQIFCNVKYNKNLDLQYRIPI